MNEEVQRLQSEIDATVASLTERSVEVERRAQLAALVASNGARLVAQRSPWLLVGLSVAAGIYTGQRLTSRPKR